LTSKLNTSNEALIARVLRKFISIMQFNNVWP
jgi:hypothetical protein